MDEPLVSLHADGVGRPGRRDGAGRANFLPAQFKEISSVISKKLFGNSKGETSLYVRRWRILEKYNVRTMSWLGLKHHLD